MVEPTSYFLRGVTPKTPIDQNRVLLSIQRLNKTGEFDVAPLIDIAIASIKSVSKGEASALHQVESLLLLLRQKKIGPAKALFDALDHSVKDKLIEYCPEVNDSIESLICYRNAEGLNLLEAMLFSLYDGDLDIHMDFTMQDVNIEYACIEKTYQELAKHIELRDMPRILSKIEDEHLFITIVKHAAQRHPTEIARLLRMKIRDFRIFGQATLIELAKLCAKQSGLGTARSIQDFGITNQADLVEIAKLCAKQSGQGTAEQIQNFGIVDQNALIEIAKLCVRQNVIGTLRYIENFGIVQETALIEIARLSAYHSGLGTENYIKKFGIRDVSDLIIHCKYCQNFQTNDVDSSNQDQLISEMEKIFQKYREAKMLFNAKRFQGWETKPLSLILARKMSRMILGLKCFDDIVDVNTWNVLCEFADLRSPNITGYCLAEIDALQKSGAWEGYARLCKDWAQGLAVLPLMNWQESAVADISGIIEAIKGLRTCFKDTPKMEMWLSVCNELDKTFFSPNEKIEILGKIICGLSGTKADQIREFNKRMHSVEALLLLKQESKLQDCADFSKLGEAIVASLSELKGLDLSSVEDYVGKWNEKILPTRASNALLIYLGALQNVGDPRLLATYTQLIKDILNGVEKEARYNVSNSLHLQKVLKINPTLWAKWQQSTEPKPISLSAKVEDAISLKEYLKGKMDAGHLEGFESLKRYLNEGGIEELKGDHDDAQTQLINLCEDPSLKKEGMINALERILRDRKDEFRGSKLRNDLQSLLHALKAEAELTLVDTDDWVDLLMCSNEVGGSCQQIHGDPNYNKGLLAYIVDGKNRMLAIKNAEGKVIARSLFRLLFDEVEGRPVLYQDSIYPHPCPPEYAAILQDFAKTRALELNCPLYDSFRPRPIERSLVSFGSSAPYEYEDGVGGITNGEFIIKAAYLVQLDESELES